MKKKFEKIVILTLSVLVVISFASGAFAEKPKGKYGEKPDSAVRVLKHGEALGLSDQQKKELYGMSFDFKKKKIRMKADIEIAKLELKRLMHKEGVSEGEIFSKVDELGGLKTALKKEKVRLKLAVRKTLTKEQQAKLHNAMTKGRAHGQGKSSPHKRMKGHPK